MQHLSPYLNPLWPQAVWDVSGAFVYDRELVSFFDFCKQLLGFEPFHVVHGAPLCAWNSGRVLRHMERSTEEIRTAGLAYAERGMALYLTFTNLMLTEEHLRNALGNALCTFAVRHNPTKRNAVIVANDLLREHLRKNYPELRLISSILRITNGGGKGKIDAYRRLAEQYDEVMVHPDDVLNDGLLEQLEDKERYILLINEYCIRHCPLRLMPSHIVAAYEAGDMERLAELKVNLCMECGCCSFGCPAHRPLVQTNKLAKAKLAAWRKLQSEKIDAKKEAVQK